MSVSGMAALLHHQQASVDGVRAQEPAVQHTPAAQAPGPRQSAAHALPLQASGPAHDLLPLHAIVFVRAVARRPPPHADAPVQSSSHPVPAHAMGPLHACMPEQMTCVLAAFPSMPPVHALAPLHVTLHVAPAQRTPPAHADCAQCTSHVEACAQSMPPAHEEPAQLTRQGRPGGQVTGVLQALVRPHWKTHVPPVHAPPRPAHTAHGDGASAPPSVRAAAVSALASGGGAAASGSGLTTGNGAGASPPVSSWQPPSTTAVAAPRIRLRARARCVMCLEDSQRPRGCLLHPSADFWWTTFCGCRH
jgi:hypothetical protein